VNINNSNNTTTTDDVNDITAVDRNCINESELPVLKSNTASLRRKCNGRVTSKQIEKTTNSEDWNSLDQFEKLVKSEMEFLTNHQKSNEPTSTNMSTKINHQPILKPEKHVSLMFHLTTFYFSILKKVHRILNSCCVYLFISLSLSFR
jgi:hypothetical protein